MGSVRIDGKVVTNGSGGICFRPPSDTTPPTVVLENTPANRVSITSVDITIADSDVVAYKYKLDGGSYGNEIPVATHIQLSGLSEAEHTLYVIGKDLAGNWQVEPTTCTWVVDLTPPVATLSNTPANQTSVTTTDIIVGGDDVVAYKYKLDSEAWSAETPVATHVQLSGLIVGSHTLFVIGKDSAGNWKPDNEATVYMWTIGTFITNGLVQYLDAETSYPGTGTTWYDISGNSRNASLANGVAFSNTSPKCMILDGVNDYISLNKTYACASAITVFMWIKFQQLKSSFFWIATNGSGTNPELRFTTNGANKITFLLYDNGAYFIPTSTPTIANISANVWINLAMTLTNSSVKFYINGNPDYSKTGFTYDGYSGGAASEHTLGTYNSPATGYGGYSKISYGKFALYNRVLSAEEIAQNFNYTRTTYGI